MLSIYSTEMIPVFKTNNCVSPAPTQEQTPQKTPPRQHSDKEWHAALRSITFPSVISRWSSENLYAAAPHHLIVQLHGISFSKLVLHPESCFLCFLFIRFIRYRSIPCCSDSFLFFSPLLFCKLGLERLTFPPLWGRHLLPHRVHMNNINFKENFLEAIWSCCITHRCDTLITYSYFPYILIIFLYTHTHILYTHTSSIHWYSPGVKGTSSYFKRAILLLLLLLQLWLLQVLIQHR